MHHGEPLFMGDPKTIFQFVLSSLNFLILAMLFSKIVIYPMAEAVKIRASKVALRLKEIGIILAEARQTEATYQEQFSRIAAEEEDLRATNQREIDRVTSRIRSQAEADARHLVGKAEREAEKTRGEALGQLQHQIVVQALAKVEGLLKQNLDNDSQNDLNQQLLGKVGSLRA